MPTKKQNKTQSTKSLFLDSDEEEVKIIDFTLKGQKVKVELRPIAIGELEQLRKKAKIDVIDPNNTEVFPFLIWAVIYCCHNAETGERLFDETDYERFLELKASNAWFNRLATEASKFVGIGGNPEERKKST